MQEKMHNEKQFGDLLKAALDEALKREMESLPSVEELDKLYKPSEEFDRRIKALIDNSMHKRKISRIIKSAGKAAAGIAIIIAITLSVIFISNNMIEISRKKYPYVGQSTLIYSDTHSAADYIMSKDISLETAISQNDAVVAGKFVSSMQDAKKQEEGSPSKSYYELLFEVTDVINGDISEGEIITVRTQTEEDLGANKPIFPDVKKGTKAVLFLKNISGNYHTSSVGFYYIDMFGRVISAEMFKGLDMYTGTDINDFKQILQDTYEKVKSGSSD